MLIDKFEAIEGSVPNCGSKGLTATKGGDDGMMSIQGFMAKKEIVQSQLKQIKDSVYVLRDIKKQYAEAADEFTERAKLELMNKRCDENSRALRDANKLMAQMKEESKKWRFNEDLKDEPEGRIMNSVLNAQQTKVYDALRLSQDIQMDVKIVCKDKISRHVRTVDPNLNDDQVEELVNDPAAVTKLVQAKMSKSVHGQVKNAMNDINEKYKELGKLEKNVKDQFEMINNLSMIVKNNTEVVNSIEENLKGTVNYIAKAADALEKAQEEYKSGNEKMCCIFVLLVCCTGILMWPIMSLFD